MRLVRVDQHQVELPCARARRRRRAVGDARVLHGLRRVVGELEVEAPARETELAERVVAHPVARHRPWTGRAVDGRDLIERLLGGIVGARLGGPLPVPMPLRMVHRWRRGRRRRRCIRALSHGRKHTEVRADLEDVAGAADPPEPMVVRAAHARFLALPLTQRSAVILKDVLDHSLEETAATMGTTVMAVKAALVRGRKELLAAEPETVLADATTRQQLDRYASLFNARDWDGVRAFVSDDCRLDLVSKSQRRGKSVGAYFGRYEKEQVTLRVVELEGELVLAAHVAGAAEPAYFILLDWGADRVQTIRDFRYVPYIVADARV